MSNIFILFKDSNIKLPEESYLRSIYREYWENIHYFTFNGKNIHANLNYNDFDLLYEDLKEEISDSECLVIVFCNNKGNFISKNINKDFYHTDKPIFVCENEINFINKMPFFDIDKNESLFNMFVKQNRCALIQKNSIRIFGFEFINDNGILVSDKILEDNIPIVKNISNLDNCYFCDKNIKTEIQTFVINKCIKVCENCFKKLKCFKCECCGEYFSNKYKSLDSKNICLECYMKVPLDKNCYLIDSWIGLEYINHFIDNIPENVNKRFLIDFFKNKTDEEINQLRIKTFNTALKNKDKLVKQREKILKRLSSKLINV